MHFKHAFITCLLVFIIHIATTLAVENPDGLLCTPPVIAAKDQKETNIMYFVDKVVDSDTLLRLKHIFKMISCSTPSVDLIKNLVMSYSSDQQLPGKDVISSEVLVDLYREVGDDDSSKSTPCDRFRRALGRAPAPFLDRKNVHFIVPMFENENEPNCFLKAFQTEFEDDSRKENFHFDGILINSPFAHENNQSVRVLVPDFKDSVDTNRKDMDSFRALGPEEKNIVIKTPSDILVESLTKMVEAIVEGKFDRDWEEILTSSTSFISISMAPNTSTSTVVSATGNSKSPFKSSTMAILNDDVESTMTSSTSTHNTTTTFPSSTITSSEATTIQNISTTSSSNTFAFVDDLNEGLVFLDGNDDLELNATTIRPNASTTTDSSVFYEKNENADEDYDDSGEELGMASGSKNIEKSTTSVNDYFDPAELEHRHRSIDANLLIYVLLLLLLIWLFCIFLCLVWMFYCAKKRKNKLIDQVEEQNQQLLPLLEKGPPEPIAPKPSISTEDDAEWNNIKPAIYTDSTATNQSKSEVESVKQPSKEAQFAPVEVSELEENKDDDMTNRPRRGGYLAPKRTSDFRFD